MLKNYYQVTVSDRDSEFCELKSMIGSCFGLGGGIVHEQVVGFDPHIRKFPENCPVHLIVTANHLPSFRQSHRLAYHELSQLSVFHLEVITLHKRRLAAD